MKRLGLSLCILLSFFLIGRSSAVANITGPHKDIANDKGVCANCHIPHYAKGKKIWARALFDKQFGGVRQLCNSCHDGTLTGGINPLETSIEENPPLDSQLVGLDNVFLLPGKYETHVMHGEADTTNTKVLGAYDSDTFPLDPNDADYVPGHPESWDKGKPGFYCGSCHDPHKQPNDNVEGGAYLRTKTINDTKQSVGDPNDRADFCKQCHDPVQTNRSHFTNDKCMTCHHPHQGFKVAQDGMSAYDLDIARLTLRLPFTEQSFVAQPNVPVIDDDPNDTDIFPSGYCYGCHQARHIQDATDNAWLEAGAAPIYGDTNIPISNRKNHHPMGSQAKLHDGTFLRAKGTDLQYLNKNSQLTCVSCHKDLHGTIAELGDDYNKSKENNFLRWDFAGDDAEFCIKCHDDKEIKADALGNKFDERHFWDTNTPLSRKVYDATATGYEKTVSSRQCMFCHFIHDGKDYGSDEGSPTPGGIRPDIDTLMRVAPRNLAWGDRTEDTDLWDYEDMCHGCHGDASIVKQPGLDHDALLQPTVYFTHRFACDPNSPATIENVVAGGAFPLADGPYPGIKTWDDYGAEKGKIYCGSCHNVHDSTVKPYLNHEAGDTKLALDNGFCEACHDENGGHGGGEFIGFSHPVNEGPKPPATDASWDPNYYSGGSGKPGGITGGAGGSQGTVICLTCHNVHACATSHEGKVKAKSDTGTGHGMLLVKDNNNKVEDSQGSNMCKDCHPL